MTAPIGGTIGALAGDESGSSRYCIVGEDYTSSPGCLGTHGGGLEMICVAVNVLSVMNSFIELADYRRRAAEMYADVRHNTLQKRSPRRAHH